jgi:hypothetical protein
MAKLPTPPERTDAIDNGARGGGRRGRGTKREFGLIETRDGRRKTARRHKRVDYREANFAIVDSDDEGEASIADEALMNDGDADASSEDDWRPRGADDDDDDDDDEFTGDLTGGGGGADAAAAAAAAAAATRAPEMRDGKVVCTYGAACYRKNPDHKAQFWHPPRVAAGVDGVPVAATGDALE